MLLVPIKNLDQGKTNISLEARPKDLELGEEFIENIYLDGYIDKTSNQLNLKLNITTNLNLICDYSLDNFSEKIEKEVMIICKLDNISSEEKEYYKDFENFIFYKLDESEIDISDIIREELILTIPMKKISPKYRDKSFEELYPEYSASSEMNNKMDIEEKANPFAVLKNVKLN